MPSSPDAAPWVFHVTSANLPERHALVQNTGTEYPPSTFASHSRARVGEGYPASCSRVQVRFALGLFLGLGFVLLFLFRFGDLLLVFPLQVFLLVFGLGNG